LKTAFTLDIFKEIKSTFNRFIAIFAIVALGVGFFAGLNGTTPDMKLTADDYYDEYNLMDIRLLSTMGFTEGDIEALRGFDGVEAVMPSYSVDAVIDTNSGEKVAKVHALKSNGSIDDPAFINRPVLVAGRLPENSSECVIDSTATGDAEEFSVKIGDAISISPGNDEDTSDLFASKEFTVVGIVDSPYYISFQRGNTDIGNGRISFFMMIPDEAFSSDYYLEVFLKIKGAQELVSYSDEYEALIDEETDKLEAFASDREDIRYTEIMDEAQGKIDDAQAELDDAKAEFDKAQTEFDEKSADAEQALDDAAAEISDAEQDIENAESDIAANEAKLNDGEADYAAQLSTYNDTVANTKAQIDNAYAELSPKKQEYEQAAGELEQGYAAVNGLRAQAEALTQQGLTAEAEQLKAQADAMQASLDAKKPELDAAAQTITEAEQYLAQSQAQYEAEKANGQSQLDAARAQLDSGWAELADAKARLEDAKGDLAKGKAEYADAQKQADDEIADAQAQLDDAQAKIDDSQKKIDDAREEVSKIEKPTWYVLSRDTNPGYAGFGSDADRIAAIARIFPFFFFLVAALVCLTTMTRMVEEQRTQIGLMKALGYGKGAIVSKYIIYASIAGVSGSIAGLALGFNIFPAVIWKAYGILYNMPDIIIAFHADYALLASCAAVASILLATIWACYSELHAVPAELMRPKAPSPGKRVFLEKIPFIWNRMGFTRKVSARNLFRYKKRFFMAIIGICGCTMLMLTGFGLRDSITNIVTKQFSDIHLYDASIMLDESASSSDAEGVNVWLDSNTADYIYDTQSSVTALSGRESFDAYLFVAEDPQQLNDFVMFRDRQTKDPVAFPTPGSVVITEKLSNELGLKAGDTFDIKKGDTNIVEAQVGGITENYIFNYIYMTPDDYVRLFGEQPEYKEILAKMYDTDITEDDETAFSTSIIGQDNVASVTFTTKISRDFGDMMKSLDSVVWVLILCANMLAFIVLYNLANINITERIREIATIKVLGFYDNEVSSYVFRENIILTVIGALAGLVCGIFLHRFVVVTAEVDVVMFERVITPLSYIAAAALTVAFAVGVNFIMHFKLKRISMVESLKSAE